MDPRFQHSRYCIRKKLITLVGSAFHIFDESGQVVFYSRQKAFKLKEDFRLYTGEDQKTEILTIKARRIIDISSEYDVYDTQTGEHVGMLKRKGLKSLLKDEWLIHNAEGKAIGSIHEDNVVLSLIRRFACNLIPQSFEGEVNGQPVLSFKQSWNPIVLKIHLDFSADTNHLLDRRLGIAAAILLCGVEGKQDNTL